MNAHIESSAIDNHRAVTVIGRVQTIDRIVQPRYPLYDTYDDDYNADENLRKTLVSFFAARNLHKHVRATRLLRRLFDDRSGFGTRGGTSFANTLAQRLRIGSSGNPGWEQSRPRSQSIGLHRR